MPNRYDWHRWWLSWLLGTERRWIGHVVTEEESARFAGEVEGKWEYRPCRDQ